MKTIELKITRRLVSRAILEDSVEDDKDIHSPNYDRQRAEDLLYHTIGPLTANPKWSQNWTSDSPVPESFVPGGRAPRWTEDEVVMAYAGDPIYLVTNSSGNPRSPKYGKGSPMYKAARKIAKQYGRQNDIEFIADLFQNGCIELAQKCKPGEDQSMSPFISFVHRSIYSAMEHGVGSELRTSAAITADKDNIRGLRSILDEKNPKKIRMAANAVGERFRSKRSYEKSADNPFGMFSADYYNVVTRYADALESGDKSAINSARSDIDDLMSRIDSYNVHVPGASSGLGQAISTSDRNKYAFIANIDLSDVERLSKTNNPTAAKRLGEIIDPKFRTIAKDFVSTNNPYGKFSPRFYTLSVELADALTAKNTEEIQNVREKIEELYIAIEQYKSEAAQSSRKVTSADLPSDETGNTLSGSLVSGSDLSGQENKLMEIQDGVTYVLDIALKYDISKSLANSQRYQLMAQKLGAKDGKMGGPLTVNEFRYLMRALGQSASKYPGKGKPRLNRQIPRDTVGWWKAGEDPEIEPITIKESAIVSVPDVLRDEFGSNAIWRSIWSRNGYQSLGTTEMAREMTEEVLEFEKYGIATGRQAKTKGKVLEAVSKIAINAALKAARVKFMIISDMHSEERGIRRISYDDMENTKMTMGESRDDSRMLIENARSMNKAERLLIHESCQLIMKRIDKVLSEDSPPGWEGTVKAMKKHGDIDNPFALAWSMKNKGYKPHYNKKGKKIDEQMHPVD